MSKIDRDSIGSILETHLSRRRFMGRQSSAAAGVKARGDALCSLAEHQLVDMASEAVCAGAASSTAGAALSADAGAISVHAADVQYCRFRAWSLDAPEPHRAQLTLLVFRVFVAMFVDLLKSGHNAHQFYSRHHASFMHNRRFSGVVSRLAQITNVAQLKAGLFNKHVGVMSERVFLTEECAEYVSRALAPARHSVSLVVRALSLCVDLSLTLSPASISDKGILHHTDEADMQDDQSSVQAGGGGCLSDTCALRRAINAASAEFASRAPQPSVCMYRVHSVGALSAAAISRHQGALAAAGDWGCRLWNIDGVQDSEDLVHPEVGLCRDSDDYALSSRVPLGCDLPPIPGATSTHAASGGVCGGVRLLAHTGAVYDVRFCDDAGRYLVTAGADSSVRIWQHSADSGGGRRCHNAAVYTGHNYPVWSVSCQSGVGGGEAGSWFVTGSMDCTGRLWAYERTHHVRCFIGHSRDVDCVCMHSNGSYVATASSDCSLRLWATNTADQVRCFTVSSTSSSAATHAVGSSSKASSTAAVHQGVVHDVQFSPDGRLLATAGEDCVVRVYDLSMGRVLYSAASHTASVGCVLWTRTDNTSGRGLITADQTGHVFSHNIHSANSTCELLVQAVDSGQQDVAQDRGMSVVALHHSVHNYVSAVCASYD